MAEYWHAKDIKNLDDIRIIEVRSMNQFILVGYDAVERRVIAIRKDWRFICGIRAATNPMLWPHDEFNKAFKAIIMKELAALR